MIKNLPSSDSNTTQPLQGAGVVHALAFSLEIDQRFSFLEPNFMHKPSQALLRKYFVDKTGTIYFIESVLAPGQFAASRLSCHGEPMDSKLVTFADLKPMTAHSELRSARALASKNFYAFFPDRNARTTI